MYYEDENDPIYNHTKKENSLSQNEFNQYLDNYPLEDDVLAYRGLFFRDKSSFDSFKRRLDNNEYYPMHPESFTRDKATAENFARHKKTFFAFLDENIFLENENRKISEECISGYAGIVIKCLIPKGKGIDINKTNHSVEDEILYMTTEPIKVDYEILDSYETQLKNKPIDINEYLQNHSLNEPLSKYIIANHSNEINETTQHKLLYEIMTPFDIKGSDSTFFIDEDSRLLIGQKLIKNLNMTKKEINIFAEPLYKYYKKGIFTEPSVIKRIEKYSHDIVNSACEFIELEHLYCDEPIYYNTRDIADLTYFVNDFTRERYQNVVHLSRPKTYNELNDSFRAINLDESLDRNAKKKACDLVTKEIEDFILEKIGMMAKNKEKMDESRQKEKEKIEGVKNRAKKLRNK